MQRPITQKRTEGAMATILLIHGDLAVRDVVRQSVPETSAVRYAEPACDPLYTAQRELPDLIIIDASNVNGDGLSLCRRLRSAPGLAHTPILVLANGWSSQEVAQLLDAGADDCLRKPHRTLAQPRRQNCCVP
jgi:DNA-binding response OmpR family regulator